MISKIPTQHIEEMLAMVERSILRAISGGIAGREHLEARAMLLDELRSRKNQRMPNRRSSKNGRNVQAAVKKAAKR